MHGLQRVEQAVHAHSLCLGWLLNVPESVVMVFGKQSVRARLDAPKLSHGGGVRAVCPPRPQSSTWGFAESRKEAGPLSKQLVQPTAGRHCVSGFRSCAANT